MMKRYRNNREAFSLIEVITVLFVVSLGLLGVLSLIIQNIQSQSLNKNNLIAYQLAQEGVELVRGVRDSNWRAGSAWDSYLSDDTYYMDYSDTVPISSPGDAPVLYLDSDGFYVHDDGGGLYTSSGFYRDITIVNNSDGLLQVLSTIYWYDHDKYFTYDLEAMLYDWY